MRRILWIVALASCFCLSAFAQRQFVYTNNNNAPETTGAPNSVSAFLVNANGTLTELAGSPFATGGNGGNGGRIAAEDIAVVAGRGNRALLFAVNQGDSTIAAFHLDGGSGKLMPVSGSPFAISQPGPEGSSYTIDASPDGSLLFVGNDGAPGIHVFAIARSGALSEGTGSPFATTVAAWGLKVTPNGQFLIAGEASADNVDVFSIAGNGSLSPVSGSPFAGSGPSSGITVSSSGTIVFHISFDQDAIDSYNIGADGTLTPAPSSPFFATTGSNNGLALTPNNRFLYVTDTFSSENSNNGAISAFSVAGDGGLSPIAGSPFVLNNGLTGGVAATTITADGKFLYSYYFVFAQVDMEAIGADGGLTSLGTFVMSFPGAGSGMGIVSYPPPNCGGRK